MTTAMRLLHLACVPKLELGSEGELELGSAREAGAWQRASWGEEIERKKESGDESPHSKGVLA